MTSKSGSITGALKPYMNSAPTSNVVRSKVPEWAINSKPPAAFVDLPMSP